MNEVKFVARLKKVEGKYRIEVKKDGEIICLGSDKGNGFFEWTEFKEESEAIEFINNHKMLQLVEEF